MNHRALRYCLLLLLFVLFSCRREENVDKHLQELSRKASALNEDFRQLRIEADTLAAKIALLYLHQQQTLTKSSHSRYQMADNGVLYKPVDDGGSAVFVSGYFPVDETIRRTVRFTEPIDADFKALLRKRHEIVQVYYNDCHSYNRIYPFFDVLSQYEAKMNIPAYNFYYLADRKHNPSGKSRWVNEPYVDPAGRGWMVSAIAPVYYQDSLVGVPGIDVTIHSIVDRYTGDGPASMNLIIDPTGTIVAAQEITLNLLSFPPLRDHKYIETIKQDTYRKEQYNVALSKDVNVRRMAVEILQQGKNSVQTTINGEKLTVLAVHIPELNWYLLELIK